MNIKTIVSASVGLSVSLSVLCSPLTIYKGAGFSGDFMECEADSYYRSLLLGDDSYLTEYELGDFDNAIRSFRLEAGYAATFANNPDGTGFSRVFVALPEAIEMEEMPEGLEYASFIRVMRASDVSKKGVCGEIGAITQADWFYDWGASAESSESIEYVPMRHNRWWDGWEKIGSRTSTYNVLGYNEPDHADQSDLSVETAIREWPNMMKSGLRIGSPAPDSMNKGWLSDFIAAADSLNYRVDFVATHMYWANQTAGGLVNTINDLCQNRYGGRPMWITEWNNGANWTNEYWPDREGARLDAEFNPLLDENGQPTTVSRPHTKANSDKQCQWLAAVLTAFDECEWLERHSLYNWVEDARSLVIDGKLTPAGQLFADHKAASAFSHDREYVHKWKIVGPLPTRIIPGSKRVRIDFIDINGETGANYFLERKIDGADWETVATVTNGVDYTTENHGKTIKIYDEDLIKGTHLYRIRATDHKGNISSPSREMKVNVKYSGVDAPVADSFQISCANGVIHIESDMDVTLPVYDLCGVVVAKLQVRRGSNEFEAPARGFYVVASHKIVVD